MQTTLYMPGEHPVGISGFVTARPYERTPGVFELDADRDQVAQQLGGWADLTWADSHAAVFGLASVGSHAANPTATEAVNYLLRVRKGPQFDLLKGPVLVVQLDDPTREVVQLVVSNDHLSVFSDFIGRYHDQRDDALAEAAEEHYREWLETAEPGDQYTVSENDHSLDPEPNDFEVIHVEAGMFSAVYHLIFASAHCALHFGLKWGEKRVQQLVPAAPPASDELLLAFEADLLEADCDLVQLSSEAMTTFSPIGRSLLDSAGKLVAKCRIHTLPDTLARLAAAERWYDPKQQLPSPGQHVLLDLGGDRPPQVGWYNLTRRRFYTPADAQGLSHELLPVLWQAIKLPELASAGKEPG